MLNRSLLISHHSDNYPVPRSLNLTQRDILEHVKVMLTTFSKDYILVTSHPEIPELMHLLAPRTIVFLGEFHCDKNVSKMQSLLLTTLARATQEIYQQKVAILYEDPNFHSLNRPKEVACSRQACWDSPIAFRVRQYCQSIRVDIKKILLHTNTELVNVLSFRSKEAAGVILQSLSRHRPKHYYLKLQAKVVLGHFEANRKELADLLIDEMKEVILLLENKIQEVLNQTHQSRESSLVSHVYSALENSEKPIVFCGRAHAKSKEKGRTLDLLEETPYFLFLRKPFIHSSNCKYRSFSKEFSSAP